LFDARARQGNWLLAVPVATRVVRADIQISHDAGLEEGCRETSAVVVMSRKGPLVQRFADVDRCHASIEIRDFSRARSSTSGLLTTKAAGYTI
jgi:hypothetical protein